MTATVVVSPPSIKLNFIVSGRYEIFRKDPSATSWGTALTTMAVAGTSWIDSTVSVGTLYEYKAIQTDGPAQSELPNPYTLGVTGSAVYGSGHPTGYIMTGIQVDETQPRGQVVLVVATDVQANLPTQLAQFEADLIADGYFVDLIPVAPAVDYTDNGTGTKDALGNPGAPFPGTTASSTQNPAYIRSLIQNLYTQNPGQIKDVILLGRVAAARSGSALNGNYVEDPDGHGVNLASYGADGFYANMTGTWTDIATNEYFLNTGTSPNTVPTSLYTNNPDGSVTFSPVLGITNPAPFLSTKSNYESLAHRYGAAYETFQWNNYQFTLGDTSGTAPITNVVGVKNTAYTVASGTINVPGDGKYDQYYMSQTGGEADMGFGRIDLSNNIAGQYEALKVYLDKVHRYKTASPDFLPGRRIAMREGSFANVDESGWDCALAVTGTGAAIDLFSDTTPPLPVPVDTYHDSDAAASALPANGGYGPYLFYFKGSGGPGIGVGGGAVFWTGMQSHWGWWYSTTVSSGENTMALRLGEDSYGLGWTWDIFGLRYFYHRMSMGFDAGDMMRVSINNVDPTTGTYEWTTDTGSTDGGEIEPCSGALFMDYFGDPTLRLFMFAPPTNLSVVPSGGQPQLNWTASTDPGVIGYHVYRSPSPSTTPFVRVTSAPVAATTYTDTDPTVAGGTGTWTYMVKAVRLETTGGGTFYNASLGASQTINQTGGPAALAIPAQTLATAYWNTAYTATLAASGGTPNFTWMVLSGTVPPGLSLAANGTLSGLATTAGSYSFSAQATDALGQTAQQTFSISVNSDNNVTLYPDTSNYVYSSAPTRLQGATETMVVSGSSLTQDSFVRFNLAGFGLNNAMVSAKLRLYTALGTTANCDALIQAALTAENGKAWRIDNPAANNVTAAANNGSGYFRLTVPGNNLSPIYGSTVTIAGVTTGTTTTAYAAANTTFTATIIDANTFDIPLAYTGSATWTKATSTSNLGITYNYRPPDNSTVPPAMATTYPVPYNYVDLDVTPQMRVALANDPTGEVSFRLFTASTETVDLCSAYSYGAAQPQLILQTTNAPLITFTTPTVNPACVYVGSGLQINATVTAIPARAGNVTLQWTQVSGPGTATFSAPASASTRVTFSAPGDYDIELTANDGVLQSAKDLTVRVLSAAVTGPTDHLVMRLPFDETTGTTAYDASGNSNNGTLINSATWSGAGEINGAVALSNSNQQVDVSDPSTNPYPLDGGSAMSFSVWFNPTALDTDSSFRVLLQKSSYTIELRNNQVYADISGGLTMESTGRVTAGVWNHVVLVFTGTGTNNAQLYVNGSPDIFDTITPSVVPRKAGTPLIIGATSLTDTHAFNGLIDEVRIYSRALTLAEVEDLYAAKPADMGPVITTAAAVSGSAGQPLALSATVADDGNPIGSMLTYSWTQLGGPSVLSFTNPTSITTSTTPSSGGAYGLEFTASDGAITTFANIAATITGQSYSSWVTQNNLTGANAADTATPANDGLTNLEKYGLGLNPNTNYPSGATGLPVTQTQNIGGTNYLTLTFDGVATDVTYDVQVANDPSSSWTTIYTSTPGIAPGTVTVPDTQAMTASTRRFMRLQIVGP